MEMANYQGKELIAKKDMVEVVMRMIEGMLYIKGMPTPQYQAMLSQMNQKHAIEKVDSMNGWIRMKFIDSIPLEDLHGKFFDTLAFGYQNMGFQVEIKDI